MPRTRNGRTRPVTTRQDRVLTANHAAGQTIAEISKEMDLRPEAVAEIIDQDRWPRRHVIFYPGYAGCGKRPPPLTWCHGYGGLVEMPCRLCRARRLALAREVAKSLDESRGLAYDTRNLARKAQSRSAMSTTSEIIEAAKKAADDACRLPDENRREGYDDLASRLSKSFTAEELEMAYEESRWMNGREEGAVTLDMLKAALKAALERAKASRIFGPETGV